MVINFTDKYQFSSRLSMDGKLLKQVQDTRLLGVILSDNLTWYANTEFIVKKAYTRMLILHKLSEFEVPIEDMLNIYVLYIRSIVENSAVVWHSSLTTLEETELERALRIILKEDYENYGNSLHLTGLPTLQDRRFQLCKSFALKSAKNEKTKDMFPLNPSTAGTRNFEKYKLTQASTSRLKDSAIPFMQRLLNSIQ